MGKYSKNNEKMGVSRDFNLRNYQKGVFNELVMKLDQYPEYRSYMVMATGSGKTVVMMYLLLKEYLPFDDRVVLYIAPNEELVEQAYSTLKMLAPNFPNEALAYHSKSKASLLPGVELLNEERVDGVRLVFTTMKRLANMCADRRTKMFKLLEYLDPKLIVIDEAHKGKGGVVEKLVNRNLFNDHFNGIPIVGMSATPKKRKSAGWNSDQSVRGPTYRELREQGEIARENIMRIDIQGDVPIEKVSAYDLNYAMIAKDKKRNRQIAQWFGERYRTLGKTLIFCINIEHANTMVSELQKEGVEAIAVHGHVRNAKELLHSFKKNKVKNVACVVGMALEGIDIPDLNTVVLARPMLSDIQFSQAIGRGCRKIPGKDIYNIVDLYSSCEIGNNNLHLMHAVEYFEGSDSERSESKMSRIRSLRLQRKKRQERRLQSHYYRAGLELVTLFSQDDKTLEGIRIYGGQSFGVELELAPISCDVHEMSEKSWYEIANKLTDRLKMAAVNVDENPIGDYDEVCAIKDHDQWYVVYDGSCGFEIVSPVLIGEDGFRELTTVLRRLDSESLKDLGLVCDYRTGMHLNLGWKDFDTDSVKKLIELSILLGPYIHSILASSRVAQSDGEPNEYCQRMSSVFDLEDLQSLSEQELFQLIDEEEAKYWAINFKNRSGRGSRLEIRSHQGTTDGEKIVNWIALWMNILHLYKSNQMKKFIAKEKKRWNGDYLPSRHHDLLDFAKNILRLGNNPMQLEALEKRRMDLMLNNKWWKERMGKENLEQIWEAWGA